MPQTTQQTSQQTTERNRRIVLAQRPNGLPDDNTLRLEDASVPEPASGEVLLRTVYLSLDPYMRGRMNDAKSVSYTHLTLPTICSV